MKLADRLTRHWYAQESHLCLARPLTWLYRGVTAARAWMYRHGWLASEALSVPVVVVGNISVGGTGKTPLVIALVDALVEHGWHPGVVSRGYGGSQREPVLLPDTPEPARFGDEPCLIRRRTGVAVAVGHDRPAAAKLLLSEGADVVVADDGLQHYRLARDVEICVIDGVRGLGNGRMLPCGPLREPPSRLRTVDFCVRNGGNEKQGMVTMRLEGDRAVHLRDPSRWRLLQTFADTRVHAVAGIGHPARFFDSLRAQGLHVIEHPFPDHHIFTRSDLDFGDDFPVLMTEKDAIKCAGLAHERCWNVPVRAELPEAFFSQVEQRLRNTRH